MGGTAKGKKGLYAEIPEADWIALHAFCADRGTTLGYEVLMAVRRHMANPPPPPAPPPMVPLPPVPPPRKGRK